MLCAVLLRGLPLFNRPAQRQVTVDQIVCRGLVRHQVRFQASGLRAADQFRQNLRRIAEQRNGHRLLARRVLFDCRESIINVFRLPVDISSAETKVDAGLLALDIQGHGASKCGCKCLSTAHSAESRSQDPSAREVVVVVLTTCIGKGLKRALNNALTADVNPASCRHPTVHEQALAVEFIDVSPCAPFGNHVGVGQQHPWRIGVGLENVDRLAGLDQQCLVRLQRLEGRKGLVEALPVACRASDAVIDDQTLRILGHLFVQIVLKHPESRLDQPVLADEMIAFRRANLAVGIKPGIGCSHEGVPSSKSLRLLVTVGGCSCWP